MATPEPKPAPEPPPVPVRADDPVLKALHRNIEVQAALLEEVRRLNRLVSRVVSIPNRVFLAILHGLFTLLGATVVFALLIGLLSRLDTVPLIGTYVTQVLEFVQQNVAMPKGGNGVPKPIPTLAETPAPDETPAAPDETPAP